jgi:hypothetical protein
VPTYVSTRNGHEGFAFAFHAVSGEVDLRFYETIDERRSLGETPLVHSTVCHTHTTRLKRVPTHLRTATAIILDAAYGYQVHDDQDELVKLAECVTKDFEEAMVPGTYIVDVIPWREYLNPF